jgi:hypothetical protein
VSTYLERPSTWAWVNPNVLATSRSTELGPVGDHVGHHGRPLPPVAAVAVLDHLLPPVGLEVDVDVGGTSPLLGEEPLEGQVEPDRVDPGEPEAPAHRRVGTRAPDLAVDVLAAGEVDEVLDHQEVAGEPEPVDDVQLVLEPATRHGSTPSSEPGYTERAPSQVRCRR